MSLTSSPKTIQESIQIAVRHPISGKSLLAKTFAQCVDDANWVTKPLKINFCLRLLERILESYFCNFRHTTLSQKLQSKTIYFGIRLLKRYPIQGIDILVELVIIELINHQKYSCDDLLIFYNELFTNFFPEITYKEDDGHSYSQARMKVYKTKRFTQLPKTG